MFAILGVLHSVERGLEITKEFSQGNKHTSNVVGMMKSFLKSLLFLLNINTIVTVVPRCYCS